LAARAWRSSGALEAPGGRGGCGGRGSACGRCGGAKTGRAAGGIDEGAVAGCVSGARTPGGAHEGDDQAGDDTDEVAASCCIARLLTAAASASAAARSATVHSRCGCRFRCGGGGRQ